MLVRRKCAGGLSAVRGIFLEDSPPAVVVPLSENGSPSSLSGEQPGIRRLTGGVYARTTFRFLQGEVTNA